MLLFKAINDVSFDATEEHKADEEGDDAAPKVPHEVQRKPELDIEQVFRSALVSMSDGDEGERKAANAFKEILNCQELKSKTTQLKHVNLKFACLRNLMIIYGKMGRYDEAIDVGIQAVTLDGEDVSLLHRLGSVALRAGDLDLALQSFRAGLKLRPGHWPCLDAAVRLTFAIVRFEECMRLCIVALDKDRCYRPAFYCLDSIVSMQSPLGDVLSSEIKELLADETLRDAVFLDDNFCASMKEAAEKVREELRRQTDESRSPPRQLLAFPQPLEEVKWSTLVNAYFDKYFELLADESLCLSVDLTSLLPKEEERRAEDEAMDVSVKVEDGANEESVASCGDPKKLSPSEVARMARNAHETLVEKRRSSRIHTCQQYVVNRWGTDHRTSSFSRERSDAASEESPVAMLSSLLLDEIREWSEEDKEKGGEDKVESTERMETGESSNDSPVSVDEGSQEDIVNMLRAAHTNTLMQHARDLVLTLGRRYDRRWPRAMLRQFSALFESVLGNNFQHSAKVLEEQRMDYVHVYIFALELQADKMQTELESMKRELLPTEQVYPRYPHLLMVHQWIQREPHDSLEYKRAILRIRWLDYIWQFLTKDQLMAEHTLEEIRSLLDEGVQELKRPNCAHDPVINHAVVESHLLGLNRCVGVVRLRSLAAERLHEEVLTAWKDEVEKEGALTPGRCEVRLLVHRAFLKTERWQEGFEHGLASIDALCCTIQDPLRLEEDGMEAKAIRHFSRRSLRITALCWEGMSAEERSRCRRGDSARLVRACCLLIQDGVAQSVRLFPEEVWLLLFDHLSMLEEANPQIRRSTARDRAEEMDLPPSLTCLFIGHEYLASHRCCGPSAFLRRILHVTGRLKRRPPGSGYHGDADDVEWLFAQALACLHGVSRKSKTRVVDDHNTEKVPIRDYTSIQVVYQHLRPDVMPEFDSVRSLSISADIVPVLKDIAQRLGHFENEFGIEDERLNTLVTRDADFFDDFRRRWKEEEKEEAKTEFLVSKEVYYLLADFHFKSRAVEEAVEFYRKDLKFNPLRFDSWAALSLARLSLIQKGLDQQDFSLMEKTISEVNVCMHGFDCALKLNSKCSKLMVENGTLCYEIFSYSDKYYRQWQLRGSYPSELLLRACSSWRREMLAIAQGRFSEAAGCGGDDEHELWYYCYMRGKCAEKAGQCLLTEVMPQYTKALRLLHKVGAKYPRRVFFYSTIPPFSLETIEVFYRCHAALLKRLLRFCGRAEQCPDLDQIEEELVQLSTCEFAQADRMKGAHKRGRTKAVVTPVIAAASSAQRRSKRRAETEESCPTSEAEPETEECLPLNLGSTYAGEGGREAAVEVLKGVLVEVDRQVDVRECVDHLVTLTVDAVGKAPPSEEERRVRQWERCMCHCLNAFELLTQRIPHHYKSVRQVAIICLTNWRLRNTTKALEYLWTGGCLEGAKFPVFALFKDRKPNNLFNGIYRNPIHDLDRCGNFSHHMRGCVDLLLRALREQCDWVGLKEVCLSLLHSIPEVKNVCVTESELSVLQRRAFALCLQSVEELLSDPSRCRVSPSHEGCLCAVHHADSMDRRRLAVYKLWRLQRQASRSFPAFKNDAFRCVARAFFIVNPQISTDVPVFLQLRKFLQLTQ